MRRHDDRKQAEKRYPTSEDAIADLERRYGPRSAMWTYEDTDGDPVSHAVRWDTDDGKDIRPVSRRSDGWVVGGMQKPWPLYGLPKLAEADRVYVCEGEKAAEAAQSIGLTATTSPHGANSAAQADWSPLAGKEVVILPDNDAAGEDYAKTVGTILMKLNMPTTVKIVQLSDLPKGGDIVDWLDSHDAVESETLKQEIEEMADAAPEWKLEAEPWPKLTPLDATSLPTFPTHALPDVLREWVEAESVATQTPADLPGLMALAVCSATIAREVEVEPRPGWREPVNMFVAVLLAPGNRKSAVFSDAVGPLRELETELIEEARPTVARDQSERRQDENRLKKLENKAASNSDAEARREAGDLAADMAERPVLVLPRLVVDDATEERLGMILAEQGGRIASMSPEGGVFDLMAGRYSNGGTPQFVVYLKGHSGDDLISDRVGRESVDVKRPALTCAFTIQPAVVEGLAGQTAFRGRGLLARFCYAFPTSWIGSRTISPPPVADHTREAYRQTVRTLADNYGNIGSDSGPITLRLSSDAQAELNRWEAEIEEMLGEGGLMEAMPDWGAKLAGATLRIAAVLHCVQHDPSMNIEGDTIKSAVEIARYLIPHAEAVLNRMEVQEDPVNGDARYVLRWIERHEKRRFTKSEAQHHGKRQFPRADDIDPALGELSRRGYIRPIPTEISGPGRPSSPRYEVNPDLAFSNPRKRSQYSRNSSETPSSHPTGGNLGNNRNTSGQSENTNPDDAWGEI